MDIISSFGTYVEHGLRKYGSFVLDKLHALVM
jgi:hypothetical protein